MIQRTLCIIINVFDIQYLFVFLLTNYYASYKSYAVILQKTGDEQHRSFVRSFDLSISVCRFFFCERAVNPSPSPLGTERLCRRLACSFIPYTRFSRAKGPLSAHIFIGYFAISSLLNKSLFTVCVNLVSNFDILKIFKLSPQIRERFFFVVRLSRPVPVKKCQNLRCIVVLIESVILFCFFYQINEWSD